MKYIFVINPKSGSKNLYDEYKKKIAEAFKDSTESYELIKTEYKGHAADIVKGQAEKGNPVRVFGIGGDGTLKELAEAAAGKENVEIGIIPEGSGNDYIKSFGNKEKFLDLKAQINGNSVAVDAIKSKEGISVNICSVGLDASVAHGMNKFRRIPLMGGSMAYNLSLVECLLGGKLGDKMKVELDTTDGKKTFEGEYLFVLAASGQYYGGGYKGAPKAITDDGLLDFILIKKPAFIKIPSLIGIYKNGKHLDDDKFNDILEFHRGYKIKICAEKEITANMDGETVKVKEEQFEIMPKAVKFVVPKFAGGLFSIKTDRLTLRPWSLSDFDDLMEFISDKEVMEPAGARTITDKEEVYEYLKKKVTLTGHYAIVLNEENKVIGKIQYQKDIHRPAGKVFSIGYELNKNYWGKGYMTEALGAAVKEAFETFSADMVSIGHTPENERSKRVIEKCGFKYEGILRKSLVFPDGSVHDDVCYSITKEEYFE